ncbi:MAG: ribosome small subunit-dependent GTPase A [Sphingobacteriales bacterium]|nr:MAG: ribosome small subunit-dependent GTPase A [Sphingobacteriales bacterium]
MQGIVYKSTGSWYNVLDENGQFRNARIKGKLKIDTDISSTNPIAVGDIVLFNEDESGERDCTITAIRDRRNYIVRVSPHNRNQKHIVAANIDQALLIVTIAEPRTSHGFIDRFLLTAEAYHIPAFIIVNKTDILKEKHREQLEYWNDMYASAGYEVIPMVARDKESVAALADKLKGKTTLFSGHSGVGKSTLINQLIPGIGLKTTEVSDWSGKGQHTTTFAEMFDLPDGGRIIDTPGVKEFGLIDIEKEELSHYFPEMRSVLNQCRFNNCLHLNEPGCAVKDAVAKEVIFEDRYFSYATILESIGQKW